MNDLIKTLKAQLYDRAVSPLFASFAISWVAFNHRLIVVMISGMPVEKKFAYIDNVLYPGYQALLPTILYPLLSACALIFLYPIPARIVFKHVRSEQKRLKEIQRAIEDETPITQEEASELRASIRKAKREFEDQITVREVTIEKLKRDLETAERRFEGMNDFEVILEPKQVEALAQIGVNQKVLAEGLFNDLSLGRVEFDHLIDELMRHGFVKELNEGNFRFLAATAKGRSYLMKNRQAGTS